MAVITTQVASASQLTGGEIILQGLELGGNTEISTLAKTFLNAFMDHLYRSKDWEFLMFPLFEDGDTSTGVITYDANHRYRAIDSIIIVAPTKDQADLKQADFKWLWNRWKKATESGKGRKRPEYYASVQARGVRAGTDPEMDGAGQIWLWPLPDKNYHYKLLTYIQPDLFTANQFFPVPGYTADDEARYPEYPDSLVLINAVADFAANYERDTQQQIIQRNLDSVLVQAVNNAADVGRGRPQVMAFDPSRWGVWRGDE